MEIFWLMVSGKLPCLFQLLTGLYCPGCGGTRAVRALLKGKIIACFFYHPAVLYGVLIGGRILLSRLRCHMTGREIPCRKLEDRDIYIGIGIIAINFIVKNLLLVIWNADVFRYLPAV